MLDQDRFNAEVDAFVRTELAKEFCWSSYTVEDALDRPCAVLKTQRRFQLVGTLLTTTTRGQNSKLNTTNDGVSSAENDFGSWDDEEDDLRVSVAATTLAGSTTPTADNVGDAPCALLDYIILYSEAFQIPVLYLDARKGTNAAASLSSSRALALLSPEELQSVLPGCNCCCETSNDESTADSPWLQSSSLPLLTPSFCDLLNRGMYHLHPCDAQSTLAAMQARHQAESTLGPRPVMPLPSSTLRSYPHTTVLGRFLRIVDAPFRLREPSTIVR